MIYAFVTSSRAPRASSPPTTTSSWRASFAALAWYKKVGWVVGVIAALAAVVLLISSTSYWKGTPDQQQIEAQGKQTLTTLGELAKVDLSQYDRVTAAQNHDGRGASIAMVLERKALATSASASITTGSIAAFVGGDTKSTTSSLLIKGFLSQMTGTVQGVLPGEWWYTPALLILLLVISEIFRTTRTGSTARLFWKGLSKILRGTLLLIVVAIPVTVFAYNTFANLYDHFRFEFAYDPRIIGIVAVLIVLVGMWALSRIIHGVLRRPPGDGRVAFGVVLAAVLLISLFAIKPLHLFNPRGGAPEYALSPSTEKPYFPVDVAFTHDPTTGEELIKDKPRLQQAAKKIDTRPLVERGLSTVATEYREWKNKPRIIQVVSGSKEDPNRPPQLPGSVIASPGGTRWYDFTRPVLLCPQGEVTYAVRFPGGATRRVTDCPGKVGSGKLVGATEIRFFADEETAVRIKDAD
jgi:hypothetical protein